jgi:hypothetical protein
MNLQWFVAKLQIHRVEDPNFLQSHYMLEVPADQNIHVRNGRQGNMQ